MSFFSITSPILSNDGVRDFISKTTVIGNPTLQKLSLQMGAIAAQAFLPPGAGKVVADLCGQLSEMVDEKQKQKLMEATLGGMPSDQKDQASKFLSQMSQFMSNPEIVKQLQAMVPQSGTQTASTGMQLSSLSMPSLGSPAAAPTPPAARDLFRTT